MDSNEICCTINTFLAAGGGEIAAGLVGAIVTYLLTSYFQVNGNQIVVEFVSRWEHDEILPDFKSELVPPYNSELKRKFYLYEFIIRNNSMVVIDETINVMFKFNKVTDDKFMRSDFLHFQVKDENNKTKLEIKNKSSKNKTLILTRGWLHPFKGRNKEEIILTVVASSDIKISAQGSGKKWRVKYLDSSYKKKQTKSEKNIRIFSVVLLISFAISMLTYIIYKFSPINLIVFSVIFIFFAMGLLQSAFASDN